MIVKISFESKSVPTPTVKANFGTFSTSWSKNLEFAKIVSCVSSLLRVRELSEDPGSLKAMCPSSPTPLKNRVIPPTDLILS